MCVVPQVPSTFCCCYLIFKPGLSLTRHSPRELAWLPLSPRDPPVSPSPALGLQSSCFFKVWILRAALRSSCSKASTLLTESLPGHRPYCFKMDVIFITQTKDRLSWSGPACVTAIPLSSSPHLWTHTDHLRFGSDVNKGVKGVQFPLPPRSQPCDSWCVILLGYIFPLQKLNTLLLWAEKLECQMTVSQTGWCSECLVKYLGVFFVPNGVGG